jgi:hypothetical protein
MQGPDYSASGRRIKMNYANQTGYTDITPFEIVGHVSAKTIEIRRMAYEQDKTVALDFHVGGFAANCANQKDQEWIITQDLTQPTMRIRLGKNGWRAASGERFQLADKPVRFYDYNF